MSTEDIFEQERDIDCLNWGPIFRYLDEKEIDSSPITELAGMPREELTKAGNMISWRKALQLMNSVKNILDQPDPRIFYFIGRESTRLGSYGVLMDMARKLGSVEQTVRFIPRFNRKFNDIFEMPVYNVKAKSGIVVVHYKNKKGYDKLWMIDQDHWNEGVIAGIPLDWELPYMETVTTLSRFSIEDIFKAYDFMGHSPEKKGFTYFANGGEIAQQVILETEELDKSLDILDSMKGAFKNRPEKERILTNRGSTGIHKVKEQHKGYLATGVIFTRDFRIGDLWTIQEGQVFGAPYSRIDVKWESKRKFGKKIYELITGNKESSKSLIHSLEEELTASKQKTYEIEKLNRNLQAQIAHEQKLERLMTGGFAHEMRNALAGAQLDFNTTLNYKDHGKPSAEILKESATGLLKNISNLHEKYKIPREEIASQVLPELKTIAEIADHLSGTISGVSRDLDRGLSITTQIREYARMSELQPGDAEVDIVPMLKDYEHRYRQDFERIGIAYSVEGLDEAIVRAEEIHLDSIFGNLIRNAKDALEELEVDRQKEIGVKIDRKDDETGSFLTVEVSDNGPGIPEEHLNEIFEPFFSTKPSSGTGLGLGIVKRLVKLYGGKIDVASKVGEGTRFAVTLP